MARINVGQSKQDDTYQFQVTVQEQGAETRHRVTLKEPDYRRLTAGEATPRDLVRASFRFLLEREPKESILRSFDLPAISRYFPEYEREIKKRLR